MKDKYKEKYMTYLGFVQGWDSVYNVPCSFAPKTWPPLRMLVS